MSAPATGATPPAGGRRRIRVLVVDDSVVIRRLVTDLLVADPRIEVVGSAMDGAIAVEKVRELQPDAVTMDIEMPRMNGIEAVREIRKTQPRLPIVMFSTLTERGATATIDALAAGASDYVTKPSNVGSVSESRQNIRDQLIPKLIALTYARRVATGTAPAAPVVPAPRRGARTSSFQVLTVGCSTGGPDALSTLLKGLPADLPVPVLVVQHMPPLFTKMLAQRLDTQTALTVREAEHGDVVRPGQVLIAPGGQHMVLRAGGTGVVVRLNEDPPENFCRPSVDVLFRSVSSVYRERTLAVVLTGMGKDGAAGARKIREAGGEVFVQDEATSVVWGMPGAVAADGQADRIVPLASMASEVVGAVSRRATGAVQR